MKLLWKDQIKKIRKNLIQFISLSVMVFLLSLVFTSVKTSVDRLEENYDSYLEEQNLEDFFFSINEVDVNYLSGTAFTELCQDYNIEIECYTAISLGSDEAMNELNILINQQIKERPIIYENFIDGKLSFFETRYDFTIEKHYVVDIKDQGHHFKFISIHEEISLPYLVAGEFPDQVNEVMIFEAYAKHNNIGLQDTITINNKQYIVSGFAYAPEFLFPIMSLSTIQFDEETQTLVFASEQAIRTLGQKIFFRYAVIGDLSQITELSDYRSVQNLDRSTLGKNFQMVDLIIPSDLNYRIITLPLEVENANAFISIFLTTFLIIITTIILLFIKRYISKYRKDIKILKSMGYTQSEIGRSYVLFPLFISLSSILGYLIGLMVSNSLFVLYSKRYFFPKADFQFSITVLLFSTVVPIILITLASYFFILQTMKEKEKTPKRIKLKVFRYIPLKTVVQLSFIFIIVNSILLFGLNGNDMFSEFIDYTSFGNNYYEQIQLRYFENEILDSKYQTFTRIYSTIVSRNDQPLDQEYRITVYGFDDQITYKALIHNEISSNALLEDGIIISDYVSEATNTRIGDTLSFKIGVQTVTYTVVGISNELIESSVYMNQNQLHEVYGVEDGYYNAVYSPDDTYFHKDIQMRLNYNQSLVDISSILNISSMIIYVITLLSIVLGLYIFGLIVILYMNENKQNIIILKALGYNTIEISFKFMTGIVVIVLMTYILSIPITWFMLDLMLTSVMNIIGFKLILSLKPVNIVIGLLFLVFILGFSIYFVSKYNDQLKVSDVLKENQ